MLACACSKTENEIDNLLFALVSAEAEGVSIDKCETIDEECTFFLSNGVRLSLPYSLYCIATIGIDGYWNVNGVKTNESVEDIDRRFIYDSNSILGTDEIKLTAAVEGYRDWFFLVSSRDPITLKKTQMLRDADTMMRGINHRGFNSQAPENTLSAFRLSVLNGFKYVETDVRFSSDGIPVLLHDKTLDRTSNGSGNVADKSFAELRTLDFGSWKSQSFTGTQIPSLEEFLQLCHSIGVCPYLELKTGTREQIRGIVEMVKDYNIIDNATFISFSKTLLKYVIEVAPHARVGLLCNIVNDELISSCRYLTRDTNHFFINSSDYSLKAIELCKKNSIPMEVWTINSESLILLLDDYVSGVTSDLLHAGRVLEDRALEL